MLLKVDNEKACFDYCQSMTHCNWFTFLPRNGFCQLFENCVVLGLENYHSFKSGPKNCLEFKSKCGFQGECKGITVEHDRKEPTLKDCFYLCSITPGCKWLTYYKNVSHCILFETCSISPCENCISGEASCIKLKTHWSGKMTTNLIQIP